jgi:hypothetical protein
MATQPVSHPESTLDMVHGRKPPARIAEATKSTASVRAASLNAKWPAPSISRPTGALLATAAATSAHTTSQKSRSSLYRVSTQVVDRRFVATIPVFAQNAHAAAGITPARSVAVQPFGTEASSWVSRNGTYIRWDSAPDSPDVPVPLPRIRLQV